MGDREIDEVSLTLGELRGEVKGIAKQVAEGNVSRRELHEKVNACLNGMAEMSQKVQALCGTVETLAATVKVHEDARNQGVGIKTLITAAFSGGGIAGLIEFGKHYFKG